MTKPIYFKKPLKTQCFHECLNCHKIIRQQTFPNQHYIEIKTYFCLECNLEMKRNLINIPRDADTPLEETHKWYTKR